MDPLFDHEKLDVYQVELQFVTWVTPHLAEIRESHMAATSEVRDQLDRAGISMLLNTAEGNGKRQTKVHAKFFDAARGSATECAAGLDALVAKNAAQIESITEGKKLLFRIVSMLSKLVDLFSGDGAFREESGEYVTG